MSRSNNNLDRIIRLLLMGLLQGTYSLSWVEFMHVCNLGMDT